ncbi:MAG TPA: hypothetical protein VFL66_10715 [Gaiellaceae bacterium]|nr:hypothetical protein [Gaiellaceae bacterium]
MLVRGAAFGLVVAALAAAPAGAAVRGRLVVRPESPVVGKRVMIEVRATAKARRLRLEIVSPTGVLRQVWLRRVAPERFSTAYHFVDDGQWLLRVRGSRIGAGIWVQQPPAPLPPFRPSTQPSLNALLQGGLVFP